MAIAFLALIRFRAGKIPGRGGLDLRFWRRKLASLLLVLKSGRLVGAIAKRLVGRVSTAAQSDGRASGQSIGLTLHVNQLDFAFHAQRTIVTNYNFGCSHSSSTLPLLKPTHASDGVTPIQFDRAGFL